MVVRPYGDTMNDGAVQVSFTLPIKEGEEAREAARQLMRKMGLENPQVVHMKGIAADFTFFVGYGSLVHSVDLEKIQVPSVSVKKMSFDEINEFVRREIGRKVVIVGAATGSDAHTVGLDAIMNPKGFHGDYGLERYPEFVCYNMGSQVPNEALVAKAIGVQAEAILVSQVVTQKNVHIPNLTRLVELLEAEGYRDRVVLICGGPRIQHELAIELGYDAGFGPGTVPSEVASFIVQTLAKKLRRGAA
ncbi:MAG: OAM dimerization domain-containing protein [Bacillota bacterium]